MVQLLASFPFFPNLLGYPSVLLEQTKRLPWPLSTGNHFPGHSPLPSWAVNPLPTKIAVHSCGARRLLMLCLGLVELLMKMFKKGLWLIFKAIPSKLVWIYKARGLQLGDHPYWKGVGHTFMNSPAFGLAMEGPRVAKISNVTPKTLGWLGGGVV